MRRLTAAVLFASTTLSSHAFGQRAPVELYPEGVPVPRSMTPDEQRRWNANPPPLMPSTTPEGPIHCVAEYEPMEGLLMAWENDASWEAILAAMAAKVTTTGDADVYMVVDTSGEQTTVSSQLSSAGVNMSRVKWVVRGTDTIWIRDYGPRYIYEGNVRAIVDHTYNRPRPNDDALPGFFATYKKHTMYTIGLVHGGGNFHLDANDNSFVTRLINNENPALTEQQIHDLWFDYQAVDTTFFTPFPTSIDSTQHIDMWMQVIADNKVVISDWPNNVGSTQDQICDNAATALAARGYTVYRTPARSVSGTHYTYTNVVMCNDIVMIPSYTNATVSPHNAPALATWQAALPNKTIYQIASQSIVTAAGVLHCIVMHVPEPLGGANPTVYLRSHRGGEVLEPGSWQTIRWSSDDDKVVTNVDILLSVDSGVSFTRTIAAMTADDGSHLWQVPNIHAPHARIRVLARDADGHTGYDQSEADLNVPGTPQWDDLDPPALDPVEIDPAP
ncbi:MAG: Agmatine deiminase [Phycisphaerae bacterium]|nr:Agmatine deiminase [Phycisphaerae bacterium]